MRKSWTAGTRSARTLSRLRLSRRDYDYDLVRVVVSSPCESCNSGWLIMYEAYFFGEPKMKQLTQTASLTTSPISSSGVRSIKCLSPATMQRRMDWNITESNGTDAEVTWLRMWERTAGKNAGVPIRCRGRWSDECIRTRIARLPGHADGISK